VKGFLLGSTAAGAVTLTVTEIDLPAIR